MRTVRCRRVRLTPLAVAALTLPAGLGAQTTTMPSTLRYGSGLMDIPVASILPSMEITGTYSGFFVHLDRTEQTDAEGNPVSFGPGAEEHYSDGSVALGLFDRAEVGTTIQSLNGTAKGGNMWGVFGRLQLLRLRSQGLALAVGARYLTAPDFGDGRRYEPGRLGFPDVRLVHAYPGKPDVNTQTSVYGVASANLRGFDVSFLPRNDLTFALGWGTGMFRDGGDLSFYADGGTRGWFFGSAIHVQASESSILTLMGEYNGFDVNLGAQYDIHGIRLGVETLALNHAKPAGGYASEYRAPKLGFLGSVAICPAGASFLCKPHLMKGTGTRSDTVWIPAPPPDTVVVTREVERPLPAGTPAAVCLATGENVRVWISARGDTLVGPGRSAINTLRPGVTFAGTYAEGAHWYTGDETIRFEKGSYDKVGGELRLDCAQIARVGNNKGVPLFVKRGAPRPFTILYVPVRPGIWQPYQARAAGRP